MKNICGPFFIVGSERSGTTMLRLMLNKHPELFVPPESHFIATVIDEFGLECLLNESKIHRIIDKIVSSKRWQDWKEDPYKLRDYILLNRPETMAELIHYVFKYSSGEKPYWGDKTPRYVQYLEDISILYPSSKFVHIIRDGRDVCVSMLKTNWFGGSVRVIASKWCYAVDCADEFQARQEDRLLTFTYEDLVKSSESCLSDICGFIGVEYEDSMTEFYADSQENIAKDSRKYHKKLSKKPSVSDLQRWKNELSPLQVLVYESVASSHLKKHGYQLKYSGILKILPSILRGVFYLADISLPVRSKLGIHFPSISSKY